MSEPRPLPGTKAHAALQRRQWGCIFGALGLVAMLLSGVAYVYLFRSVPLRISKETTYITRPLTADGKRVDYLAAWEQETYPESISTDENGYRLIVEHLGKSPEADALHFALLCEKLGLDAAAVRADTSYEGPEVFVERCISGAAFDPDLIERLSDEALSQAEPGDHEVSPVDVLQDRLSRPWTADDLPMMEDWLVVNEPALDLIGEAVRKPAFHIPWVKESEDVILLTLPLCDVSWMRSFARGLGVRAHFRIAEGDIDGAIDDTIACLRLGRRVGHGGPLIQWLEGIAIEGIAHRVGIAGSFDRPPTRAQLQRLADGLSALPEETHIGEPLQFERYMGIEIVQAIAIGKGLPDVGLPAEISGQFAIDWNLVAARFNDLWDTVLSGGDFVPRSRSLKAIVSRREKSEGMADFFAGHLLPAFGAAREAGHRCTCAARLHAITLAMLLYERDHGTLPPAYTADDMGNPLHSWRVLLLPYLGQQKLYDQIRLDEPWDSDHNRQFHAADVAFYQCPSAMLAPGHTTYSVVVGPDVAFEGHEGRRLADFGEKSSRLILVVERKEADCWMDPKSDVTQSVAEEGVNAVDGTPEGIGSFHPGGANCGFRDGGVRFIADVTELETFKQLLAGKTEILP